jgi:hypothetical protein
VADSAICPTCGQPVHSAETRAREAIRAALDEDGRTQAWLAEKMRVTQKHMSQILTGKVGLSFDFAERCLAVLGRRLVTTVETPTPSDPTSRTA